MFFHLTTTINPVIALGALTAAVLFIAIMSAKERRNDPERA